MNIWTFSTKDGETPDGGSPFDPVMLEESDEVDADIGNIYRLGTPSVSQHLPEVSVTDMEDQDLFPMTDVGTPRWV